MHSSGGEELILPAQPTDPLSTDVSIPSIRSATPFSILHHRHPARPFLSASVSHPSCTLLPSPLPRSAWWLVAPTVPYRISTLFLPGIDKERKENRQENSKDKLTVICSLKKSRSSSQLSKVFSAVASFDSSSVSASAIGYASITLAPSQR